MSRAIENELIEIMGNKPPWRLVDLYDEATGRYFSPAPAPRAREMIKDRYLRMMSGASEVRFDSIWPRIWELTEFPHDPNHLIAILDTGVLARHPLLRGLHLRGSRFHRRGRRGSKRTRDVVRAISANGDARPARGAGS